jgi:hypothetical protein
LGGGKGFEPWVPLVFLLREASYPSFTSKAKAEQQKQYKDRIYLG